MDNNMDLNNANTIHEEVKKIKENITKILENEEKILQVTQEINQDFQENLEITENNIIENKGATSEIIETESENQLSNSLCYLNQYGSSSSSSESLCDKNEIPIKKTDERMENSSSSDTSSSSSSDSSDSSDSSSSEDSDDDLEIIQMEIDKSTKKASFGPIRAKGEKLIHELPPIEKLSITVSENECVHIGNIQSIVEKLVLIESLPGQAALDLDTVLFLANGKKTLGKIFDVLGQINSPIYVVRFNSREDIDELNFEIREKVYFSPSSEHTSYVILTNIMSNGCDASWENDIEVDDYHRDYSSDEGEKAARRAFKALKTTDEPSKRQKTHKTAAQRGNQRLPNPYSINNTTRQQYQNQPNWNNNGAGTSYVHPQQQQPIYPLNPMVYSNAPQIIPYLNMPPPPPPPQ